MQLKRTIRFLLLISSLTSVFAYAGSNKLIGLSNGKPTPGLATSWSKLSDGKYEFTLDLTKKIGSESVNAGMVKTTLERRMKKYKVAVTPKGSNKVIVKYQGEEAKFLKKLSKVSIRGSKGTQIALSSSVSDGGIRAKKAIKDPKPHEVKAKISYVKNGVASFTCIGAGNKLQAANFQVGKKYKVKVDPSLQLKRGDAIMFTPVSVKDGVWVAKDIAR